MLRGTKWAQKLASILDLPILLRPTQVDSQKKIIAQMHMPGAKKLVRAVILVTRCDVYLKSRFDDLPTKVFVLSSSVL
jgi:hypothetical protein